MVDPRRERFRVQSRLAALGPDAQDRLAGARAVLIGCGATGSALAESLVRAGLGHIALVDRDYVEASNLPRQRLYDDRDARELRAKAVAARDRLCAIDPALQASAYAADFGPHNARELLAGADLALDGTDNFEARFLLDEACQALSIPWVLCGVVGTAGQAMAIRPGVTACLRCYLREPPAVGSYDTCDTAGVLGAAVDLVASLAAMLAIRLLVDPERVPAGLLVADLWAPSVGRIAVPRRADCPCCARQFRYLDAPAARAARLCGRDAVQLPAPDAPIDLDAVARQLAAVGPVRRAEQLVRCSAPDAELLVFADGRTIVRGTSSIDRARSLAARYLGR